MPRVLFLLPTSTYRAEAFLEAASARGVQVTAASERPNSLLGKEGPGYLCLDFQDPDRSLERVLEHHERERLDGVVAVDEDTAVVAAAVGEALGFRHNPVEAAWIAKSKERFREKQRAAGLPHPDYRLLRFGDPLQPALSELPFPLVLKPLALSGSRGVMLVEDAQALPHKLDRLRKILAKEELGTDRSLAESFLLEEYLPGPELALEGLLTDGIVKTIAIFEKPNTPTGPCFEETMLVQPAQISAESWAEIESAVQTMVRAMGLRWGPIHAELRLADTGPILLELAARPIGGRCSKALRFDCGWTLEEFLVAQSVGSPLPSPDLVDGASGVYMIPVQRAGDLREVRGVERALLVPGVTQIELTAHKGQSVKPLPEESRYLGFVFARGATSLDVGQALETACSKLQVRIDPS